MNVGDVVVVDYVDVRHHHVHYHLDGQPSLPPLSINIVILL